ncbi:binding-protein-dependent transport systems inner membrane component [Beutenbergia cavernae DSM 12333]|uniref:Binding-protein-dependent transport systems inner membrane component n=1 Tax=Beutenbergia cavernae (strain ATCC BAA-8 / DSM 12333 / CCUG 43141 / JCM 11478 / NBRC 16432 / NCIMB 13614 / HKI 0122) TaxID=471853 RepID=C5BWB7_BEUC1|nr:sugar ABC transporter permease [Beutenbergia cavernae]ACQ78575.1 binding-protein-dependent transport systems inner membrane component [Beutenbergia cavernae DSM 12333]
MSTSAPARASSDASAVEQRTGATGNRPSAHARREARTGWLWVQSWLVGFLLFTLFPLAFSLYLAFTEWNGRGAPRWIGLQNFSTLAVDPLFWQSVKVTAVFSVLYLPLSLVIGFGMAMLMNQRLRGVRVFRTIYYLPSVLSGVAVAVLWQFVFNRDYGLANWLLSLVGVGPVNWLQDSSWVIPALVIMQLWGVGSSIIIYLGGLQGIPTELYEVASMDGAGFWRTLTSVTLPMMSPVIFFQVVLGIISTLQIFTQAYIMTGGGPNYGSYFLSLNIFNQAFTNLRLGYSSAIAWVLFLMILAITLVIFRTSKYWVHDPNRRD